MNEKEIFFIMLLDMLLIKTFIDEKIVIKLRHLCLKTTQMIYILQLLKHFWVFILTYSRTMPYWKESPSKIWHSKYFIASSTILYVLLGLILATWYQTSQPRGEGHLLSTEQILCFCMDIQQPHDYGFMEHYYGTDNAYPLKCCVLCNVSSKWL